MFKQWIGRALFVATLAGVAGSLGGAGCAATRRDGRSCAPEAWAGTCQLRGLLKFEDRTLPIPYLVYEAIYAPQPNNTYPNYTPAETRLRFGAPAQYELSLYDHLKAQSSVSCQLPTARGTCIPKTVVVNVVPFDQEHAASTATLPPSAPRAAPPSK